jgi:hypothetical protein
MFLREHLFTSFALFIPAEPVGTVTAEQRGVRFFVKPFGMDNEAYFPDQKYNYRKAEQAYRIEARDKKQRREHHHMIPVEYPAGRAAAGLQNPCLKGAPE